MPKRVGLNNEIIEYEPVVIKARTTRPVELATVQHKNRRLRYHLLPERDYLFESNFQMPGIQVAASVVSGSDKGRIFTNITNTSNRDIVLKPRTIIGRVCATHGPITECNLEGIDVDSSINNDINHEGDQYEYQLSRTAAVPIAEFEEQMEKSMKSTVLTPREIHELKSLLRKYQDRFAPNPLNPGTTDAVVHSIPTDGAKPVKNPPARANPEKQAVIKNCIEEMASAGIIKPSRSPWASRIVITKKKDGGPRFCVDYRDLNNVTAKDSYPLPNQGDILDTISDAKYFSSLDLASGYWQIKLDKESQLKTAFVSRYGLYQFTVMPFGLTNAPATFQRLMDLVLAGLNWIECMVYLDDIIVFSSTWHEHLLRLEKVFKRLREFKLVAKMSKCQFGRKELEFLGHILSAEGISTDPNKVKAMETVPNPTNVSELRSFLGMVGYYRRFIP